MPRNPPPVAQPAITISTHYAWPENPRPILFGVNFGDVDMIVQLWITMKIWRQAGLTM